MAAAATDVCTLCQEDDVSNVAVTWCSDCETYLCSDCAKHHGRIKATKLHNLISCSDLGKLPSHILETKNRCEDHDRRFEFYCQFHACECCVLCVKGKHKECAETVPISDIVNDIKSSAAVHHLETDLNSIIADYETATKTLSENLKYFYRERENAIAVIREDRGKINEHLDKIEKDMVDELESQYEIHKSQMQNVKDEIEIKKNTMEKAKDEFVQVKQLANNFQIFSSLKIFEKLTTEDTNYIKTLQNEGKFNRFNLELDTSLSLNTIMNDIKSFGSLKMSNVVTEINFGSGVMVQVQKSEMSSLDDVVPIQTARFKLPYNPCINSCCVLSDDRLVFVDQDNSRLIKFNRGGVFVGELLVTKTPWDMCHFEDGKVAVTFPNLYSVFIIDKELNNITAQYTLPYRVYGIDYDCQQFVVSFADDRKIGILDKKGKVISELSIPDNNIPALCFLKNKIYNANWLLNSVSCYGIDGNLLWTYTHKDISEPWAIDVSKHGIVFVACRRNNKVVVVSKDGSNSRVILSEQDGMTRPRALDFNNRLSMLLVGNKNDGQAFVYKISML